MADGGPGTSVFGSGFFHEAGLSKALCLVQKQIVCHYPESCIVRPEPERCRGAPAGLRISVQHSDTFRVFV